MDPDVHAWALSDGLESLQDRDGFCAVRLAHDHGPDADFTDITLVEGYEHGRRSEVLICTTLG